MYVDLFEKICCIVLSTMPSIFAFSPRSSRYPVDLRRRATTTLLMEFNRDGRAAKCVVSGFTIARAPVR